MNRRQFLKQGLMAGSALVVGSSLYGCSDLDILDTELINDDVSVALAAVLPAFLHGALPEEPGKRAALIERTINGIKTAM